LNSQSSYTLSVLGIYLPSYSASINRVGHGGVYTGKHRAKATVSSTLAMMELKGIVRQMGGMNYILARA
jgi:hypothetical protein